MMSAWSLECSECRQTERGDGLPTLCNCGAPWLVRYTAPPALEQRNMPVPGEWSMWRYRGWLPIAAGEKPVTLGEGCTPLVPASRLAERLQVAQLMIKDESQNPTGSFKCRGLSAAVTRAKFGGATGFTVPTAGNAGVALSAYARRAGLPVRVFAPATTPPRILEQIRMYGAELALVDGHIGDCGTAARSYAAETGFLDVSTLREPYRIEGKKTLGLEIAEQLGWTLPTAVIYPTGGGTGLIGMWKAFRELRDAGWIEGELPRLYSVQAEGCAPVVAAFEADRDHTQPWADPRTIAAGLRVPTPLGGRLILRTLRESGGAAVGVSDHALRLGQQQMAADEGVDAAPEGGATIAALEKLLAQGLIDRDGPIVLFNTGAGWLYQQP